VRNDDTTIKTALSEFGWPPQLAAGTAWVDSDGDGLPDAWEAALGGDVDGAALAPSGYSYLEEWLYSEALLGDEFVAFPAGSTPSPTDDASSGVAEGAALSAAALPNNGAAFVVATAAAGIALLLASVSN
jgi:hypothetical protein